MFFAEGTRSRDGRIGRFSDGAFRLALLAGVPVLPVAVDGSRDCLPRKSWRFGKRREILLRVLPPISPEPYGRHGAAALRDEVRRVIIRQVAEWRGVPESQVDALTGH
jgi:1-acyl-sn-glycerol-3-phosphate acyltransferase